MRAVSVLSATALGMVLVLGSGAAWAGGDGDSESSGAVMFGVGALGALGGNFLDKPDDTHPKYQGVSIGLETYPGFGGMSGGGGLMLEGRFIGLLGLEVDVLRSSDHGHGDLTINGTKFTMTIGQSATHVPVLAKLVAPLPVVRPMVFVGPEFVFPSSAEGKVDPVVVGFPQITAKADSYTMVSFGLGMEFVLPVPSIDLRIPFTLRGGYNPSAGDTLDDRATHTITPAGANVVRIDKIEYKSEWRYQTYATLGVAAYF
jgi:hypothetical protein